MHDIPQIIWGFSAHPLIEICVLLLGAIITVEIISQKASIVKHKTFLIQLSTITLISIITRLFFIQHEFLLSTHHGIAHVYEGLKPYLDLLWPPSSRINYPQTFIGMLRIWFFIVSDVYTQAFNLNAIIGGLSVFLMGVFTHLYFQDKSVALLAAIYLCFFPYHLRYSGTGALTISFLFFAIIALIHVYLVAIRVPLSSFGLWFASALAVNCRWEGGIVIALCFLFAFALGKESDKIENSKAFWIKVTSSLLGSFIILQKSVGLCYYYQISTILNMLQRNGLLLVKTLLCLIVFFCLVRYISIRKPHYLPLIILAIIIIWMKILSVGWVTQPIKLFTVLIYLPFLAGVSFLIYVKRFWLLFNYCLALILMKYAILVNHTGSIPYGRARTELILNAFLFPIAAYGVVKMLLYFSKKIDLKFVYILLTVSIAGSFLAVYFNREVIWDAPYSPQKEYELLINAPLSTSEKYVIASCQCDCSDHGHLQITVFKPSLSLLILAMKNINYTVVEYDELLGRFSHYKGSKVLFYLGVDCYRRRIDKPEISAWEFVRQHFHVKPIIERQIEHRQFLIDMSDTHEIREPKITIGLYELSK